MKASTDPGLSALVRAIGEGPVMTHDAEPPGPVAVGVQVLAPDGARILVPPQIRLTFGRGHETDIVIPSGRDLSRRAGEIAVDGRGALVMNLSRCHALFVEGDGYHVRRPRADDDGPPGGWLVARGTAMVGSMAMMRGGMAVHIIAAEPAGLADAQPSPIGSCRADGTQPNGTVRPFMLRADTKLFLVALLLCRPWLLDPGHVRALPTSPQIARQALEFVSASHQLERFDRDQRFRKRLVEQVNDHLKYLRERVLASGLVPEGTRLAPAAMAEVLLVNDIVTHSDLAVTEQRQWRSRQEDLWWMTR
jgi:hypothetical protein